MKKNWVEKKIESPDGGHFDYRWKAKNLIRWSPYSWVTSRKNWRDPIIIFQVIALTRIFFNLWPWVKKVPGGVECLYEFILLHHVGVVAKRVGAEASHEGDDNTPSGPTDRGVTMIPIYCLTLECQSSLDFTHTGTHKNRTATPYLVHRYITLLFDRGQPSWIFHPECNV